MSKKKGLVFSATIQQTVYGTDWKQPGALEKLTKAPKRGPNSVSPHPDRLSKEIPEFLAAVESFALELLKPYGDYTQITLDSADHTYGKGADPGVHYILSNFLENNSLDVPMELTTAVSILDHVKAARASITEGDAVLSFYHGQEIQRLLLKPNTIEVLRKFNSYKPKRERAAKTAARRIFLENKNIDWNALRHKLKREGIEPSKRSITNWLTEFRKKHS